ncbi:uncharacterized protein LOC110382488 [Helicoverpa armigera]|uniref:uncharacterized protein LOC110382488 n=1 Tax=Helicoverpa armigera TaxID=29058 RepID=UPI003082DE20
MISDDNQSGLFRCSESKSPITSVDGTSNPKSAENYSVFDDGSCGEPLVAQHVIVDFTPNDDDTDFLQKKVCSFWTFINNNPDIQNLKVQPEFVYRDESSTSIVSETPTFESRSTITADSEIHKTAVDMLVYAEERKFIDTLFDAKMPMTNCSLGSREYKEGQVTRPKKKDKKKLVCTCKSSISSCPVHSSEKFKQETTVSPIRVLNRKMNEWDAKHPKSMEPPGQAPALQHCTIQRTHAQAIKRKQDALDKAKSSGEPMRAQHLVIDFAPGREDTPEIQARCHQYWELAKNKTDHERKHPSPKPERHLINLSSSPPHLDTGTDRNNLPAIHSMKKTKKKGCVKAPFGSGEMNPYFT